jgi:hypothetical protein
LLRGSSENKVLKVERGLSQDIEDTQPYQGFDPGFSEAKKFLRVMSGSHDLDSRLSVPALYFMPCLWVYGLKIL